MLTCLKMSRPPFRSKPFLAFPLGPLTSGLARSLRSAQPLPPAPLCHPTDSPSLVASLPRSHRALRPRDANLFRIRSYSRLRLLAEISRNRPPVSPVESATTDRPPLTPLESALTKKGGGAPPLAWASSCHERSPLSPFLSRRCTHFPSQQGGTLLSFPQPLFFSQSPVTSHQSPVTSHLFHA